MKCKIDKNVYQDDTNLLKAQHGNSFANLHTCPKLGLLHLVLLECGIISDKVIAILFNLT